MSGYTKHLKALKRRKRKGKHIKEAQRRARRKPVLDADAQTLREFAARLGLA